VFTARYGLISYIKQIVLRPQKFKQISSNKQVKPIRNFPQLSCNKQVKSIRNFTQISSNKQVKPIRQLPKIIQQ